MPDRLNARGLDESALKAARLAWTAEYVGGREGANPLEAAIAAYLAARGSVSLPNEDDPPLFDEPEVDLSLRQGLRGGAEARSDPNERPASLIAEAFRRGWEARPVADSQALTATDRRDSLERQATEVGAVLAARLLAFAEAHVAELTLSLESRTAELHSADRKDKAQLERERDQERYFRAKAEKQEGDYINGLRRRLAALETALRETWAILRTTEDPIAAERVITAALSAAPSTGEDER